MGQDPVAFAVTTRSALKGYRHFPLMLVASMRIRRQLARTPGVVGWASVVVGPREFWTVTVWGSRDRMMAFMGSGAHESIMWLFGKWLRSFWLARWRPTTAEHGDWDGVTMAPTPPTRPAVVRTPKQQAALDSVLQAFPRLGESLDDDGAATLASAGFARRRRRAVEGVSGLMFRVTVPRLRDAPGLWAALARIRRELESDAEVLRFAAGLAKVRQVFVLVLLPDIAACDRLDEGSLLTWLRDCYGDGVWSMRWEPDNEFGHWDGLRLRQQRQRHDVALPPGVAEVADS